MSVDKLVDSTQLDTDLTSVANAIRTKGGTSAQLAFPAGFVSAIDAIPTGGGGDTFGDYLATNLGDYSNDTLTIIKGYSCYRYAGGAGNLRFPNVTEIGVSAFYISRTGDVFFAPKARLTGGSVFYGDAGVKTAVLKCPGNQAEAFRSYIGMALETVDFADTDAAVSNSHTFGNRFFQNCASFNKLILRAPDLYKFTYMEVFLGTPFASGGSGGTIYIPKSLYDHLGDDSSLDYKAATNWSTLDGYGTITWAKIEGSIYENAYADGTPIS